MAQPYKNFIFNEERGFIFAYVPKVASTNWKSLLRHMAGQKDWLKRELTWDKTRDGLRYLDLDGPDVSLLTDPGIRKYTMVRDPYSRLLSAYLDKIASKLPLLENRDKGNHYDRIVEAIDLYRETVLDSEKYKEITFKVFIMWIANEAKVRDGKGHMRTNQHWAPQVQLLRWDQVKYDVVGRFEDIVADSNRILSAMGCELSFPTQKDIGFAPTNARDKISKYYDSDTLSIVRRTFSEDIENFSSPSILGDVGMESEN